MTNYDEEVRMLKELPSPKPFEGISRQVILSYSASISIPFPESLVDWLELVNGAHVDSQALVGIKSTCAMDIDALFQLFPCWKSSGFIPVATDGCGNYYVIITNNSYGVCFPVAFIDHEKSILKPDYLVASDFRIFVCAFIRKELGLTKGWPFDKAKMVEIDPNLLKFNGIALPWEE